MAPSWPFVAMVLERPGRNRAVEGIRQLALVLLVAGELASHAPNFRLRALAPASTCELVLAYFGLVQKLFGYGEDLSVDRVGAGLVAREVH